MRPLTDRQFWERTDQSAGPNSCWPWIGYRGKGGYGELMRFSKRTRAHRVALLIAKGYPPFTAALALHHCDNRGCCNPTHLYWGTHADNSRDASIRGRFRPNPPRLRGEAHGRAKLTEGNVRDIRCLLGTESMGALAVRFSVSRRVIYGIAHREIWKHVE